MWWWGGGGAGAGGGVALTATARASSPFSSWTCHSELGAHERSGRYTTVDGLPFELFAPKTTAASSSAAIEKL